MLLLYPLEGKNFLKVHVCILVKLQARFSRKSDPVWEAVIEGCG
jgi:hypothetical protein